MNHNVIKSDGLIQYVLNPQLLVNKPALLGIVMIFVLGVLAVPVILPHLFHGAHTAHILLHVGSIILATFLAVLGTMAYSRARTKRMGFTCVGLFMFVSAEAYMLVDITWPFTYTFGSLSLSEISHIMLLIAFCTMSMGVFRND